VTRYALGLGSNLGDRLAHLRSAVAGLADLGRVEAVSPLYETDPVGGPDQEPYLNAVVVLVSGLEPGALLEACQGIETRAGRVRDVRWGPRTLDIDLVASDGPDVSGDDLVLPHPEAARREFVLRPLTDVWPDVPVGPGVTARQALEALEPQGVRPALPDWV
jgi:2-amino-4-hydroxy-6-hydroxymethyldihydropteridine diphosphokinase